MGLPAGFDDNTGHIVPVPANDRQGTAIAWAGQHALADRLYTDGAYAAAASAYRDLIALDVKKLEGYVGVSRCARSRGDYETSLAVFEAAKSLYPEHIGVSIERAADLHRLQRLEDAAAEYIAVLDRDPENAFARYKISEISGQRARLAQKAGDFEQAAILYYQAAAVMPDDIGLQLGLVDAMIGCKRRNDALSQLMTLADAFGPQPDIMARQQNVLRETGQFHLALQLGRDLTALHPKNFWIWLERCKSELLLGSDADILACLSAMPAVAAQEQAVLRQLSGQFLARNWNIEASLAQFESAALLDPGDIETRNHLIRLKLLLFDIPSAKESLTECCRLASLLNPAQKTKVSQSHFGQIIDEYCLEEPLLTALTALQRLPPHDRVNVLRVLVLDHPESTAVAISLMVALRQTGAFSFPLLPKSGARIPKKIVQFWQASRRPPEIAAAMRFWKDLNHDHAYDDFDLLSADKWLEVSLPAAVTSAYRRAREPEQKGDIFRLAWLAREGGIYVSAQDCCLKPISALLPEAASLVVYQDDFAVLGTNFIAAAPSNPVITTALRLAVDAVNRGDSDIGWLSTGPALLTRAFAQFAAERPTTDGRSPDGTVVHTQRVLSQSIAIHCAIDRGG